jgi:hypothetical protein
VKLVAAWIGMLVVAGVVAISCSIKHPSEQFECATQADCDALGDNRVCTDGLCVGTGGNGKDAGVDAVKRDAAGPDAAVCPAACTSCSPEQKECLIDCAANPSACVPQVICPTGWACDIRCTTQNACRNGIDCRNSTSCSVDCAGNSACRNIACGPGSCDVSCTGINSCRGIQCGPSCACDVTCGGGALCESVFCTALTCRTFEGGCDSMRTGCETCP